MKILLLPMVIFVATTYVAARPGKTNLKVLESDQRNKIIIIEQFCWKIPKKYLKISKLYNCCYGSNSTF